MITLKQNNGQLIATRGGTALICPFSGGVPVMREQKFGNPTMEVERLPCGSHCPHFDYDSYNLMENADKYQLRLSCGNYPNVRTVGVEKETIIPHITK